MNIRSLRGYAYYVRKHRCSTRRHVRPARGNARDRIRPKSLSILPSFVLVLPLAGLVSVENNASPHKARQT